MIQFSSRLINGFGTPVYDWLLNGNDSGDSSATYSNPGLMPNPILPRTRGEAKEYLETHLPGLLDGK